MRLKDWIKFFELASGGKTGAALCSTDCRELAALLRRLRDGERIRRKLSTKGMANDTHCIEG